LRKAQKRVDERPIQKEGGGTAFKGALGEPTEGEGA